MKHLKIYDSYKYPIFNVGDIVKCVYNKNSPLELNDLYTISFIHLDSNANATFYCLVEFPSRFGNTFREDRFVIATQKEIDDNNLRISAKKYNL